MPTSDVLSRNKWKFWAKFGVRWVTSVNDGNFDYVFTVLWRSATGWNSFKNLETYIVRMTEVNAPENLKDVFAWRFFTQATAVFLKFIQNCVVHILKH